jgi:alkylated DNA nucleotide flippase Atl1
MIDKSQLRSEVFKLINKIQHGNVASYGVVGEVFGISGWEVGRILSSIPQDQWGDVAWQRVVAKDGTISTFKLGFRGELQRQLLLKEGVDVVNNRVDIANFGLNAEDLKRLN